MEDQDDLIIRKPECDQLGSELNAKAALEDVGHNADLYIAIQEDNMQDQEPAQRRSLCNVYIVITSVISQKININITTINRLSSINYQYEYEYEASNINSKDNDDDDADDETMEVARL